MYIYYIYVYVYYCHIHSIQSGSSPWLLRIYYIQQHFLAIVIPTALWPAGT